MTNHFVYYITLLCELFVTAFGKARIDPALASRISKAGSEQPVFVSFTQSMDSVFSKIDGMTFTNYADKRTTLTELQESFTDDSQRPLQTFLKTQGFKFESFWINNKMLVTSANSDLVNDMSEIEGVSRIDLEPQTTLPPLKEESPVEYLNYSEKKKQNKLEWGIERIRANQVWNKFKGRNIVVANIGMA